MIPINLYFPRLVDFFYQCSAGWKALFLKVLEYVHWSLNAEMGKSRTPTAFGAFGVLTSLHILEYGMKDQMAESKKLFTVNKSAKWSPHRRRKRPKHSFSSTEIYFRMCSAAFSQVQHSLPLCMYKCVARKGVLGCVGDYKLQDLYLYSLQWLDSEPTKLWHHKTKASEGRGLRKVNNCREVFCQVTFKTKIFCVAFYEFKSTPPVWNDEECSRNSPY